MHYLLIYDVVSDYAERRVPFRAAHLAHAWASVDRGELVLGGALAEPAGTRGLSPAEPGFTAAPAGTRGLSPAEPGFTAAPAGTRGLSPAEPGFTAAPCDGAVLLFDCDSPAPVEAFAQADPYVQNGLVVRWRVRAWTTVVGEAAKNPIRELKE